MARPPHAPNPRPIEPQQPHRRSNVDHPLGIHTHTHSDLKLQTSPRSLNPSLQIVFLSTSFPSFPLCRYFCFHFASLVHHVPLSLRSKCFAHRIRYSYTIMKANYPIRESPMEPITLLIKMYGLITLCIKERRKNEEMRKRA